MGENGNANPYDPTRSPSCNHLSWMLGQKFSYSTNCTSHYEVLVRRLTAAMQTLLTPLTAQSLIFLWSPLLHKDHCKVMTKKHWRYIGRSCMCFQERCYQLVGRPLPIPVSRPEHSRWNCEKLGIDFVSYTTHSIFVDINTTSPTSVEKTYHRRRPRSSFNLYCKRGGF